MDRTVLCVDTDARISTVSTAVETEDNLTAIEARSVEDALDVIGSEPVVGVVTAYDLADGTGMDVIQAVREQTPQTPVVLFTDVSPAEIDTNSVEEVLVEYLNRDIPDATDRLGFIVNDVIDHSAQVGFLTPDNEDERLDALDQYDIDSLPIEESFERLTDLITAHFDVAVAFVGLIEEDEENFLACTGGDWDSLTREDTICTHSMLQEDVMVVEDIANDKRFNKNEQLENLGIVSYAGANMTSSDGHVIGQVCALGHEPRRYTAKEKHDLEQFADTAMEILELRQSVLDNQDVEVHQ
ncbi:response regulator receiver modulated GAF sensor protein [Halorhabdus utahensis DSM 12940]|uniref:Response regulator receiver modulated GAF sensor protein n=1 Tax=Halorhabdus utahensis (strain DSM 12940 / JCM 11049 / AX-2) TaxID=519442 RepID=C7NPH5_HALUD|nr:GAF domain-containing protein [Halorhabdus utahensis]ACV12730.1 response regulator receiver modulated GAF sensor protein [Halorhabdus utahensis DSM 12940]